MSQFRVPSISEIGDHVDTLEFLEQIELSDNAFSLEVLIEKMQRYATMLQFHLSYAKNLMVSTRSDVQQDRDMLVSLVGYAQARVAVLNKFPKHSGL